MPLNFSGAFYFSERFVGNLERIKNPISRDITIKWKLGVSEETMTKSVEVLANLDRWIDNEYFILDL